jgi:hypothetical protein
MKQRERNNKLRGGGGNLTSAADSGGGPSALSMTGSGSSAGGQNSERKGRETVAVLLWSEIELSPGPGGFGAGGTEWKGRPSIAAQSVENPVKEAWTFVRK